MSLTIREANPDDAGTILRYITDLAVFEKAAHQVEATVESLTESLFGPDAVAKAALCEISGVPVGFAIWFYNYSTWQGRKGLYLEDLYIEPAHRGAGHGRAVLRYFARRAIAEGCGRFEWSVLDWNQSAISVYESVGAEPMREWLRYRLSAENMRTFANSV